MQNVTKKTPLCPGFLWQIWTRHCPLAPDCIHCPHRPSSDGEYGANAALPDSLSLANPSAGTPLPHGVLQVDNVDFCHGGTITCEHNVQSSMLIIIILLKKYIYMPQKRGDSRHVLSSPDVMAISSCQSCMILILPRCFREGMCCVGGWDSILQKHVSNFLTQWWLQGKELSINFGQK